MPSIYENERRQKRCQGQPHMKHGIDTNLTSPAQGQKTPPKLLPRSKQQIFVGYDDGSKSIKYYNPDTRKVLTSRNYKFLTYLPNQLGTPEPIQVNLSPAVPCEGEHDQLQPTLQPGSQCIQSKRQREESQTEDDDYQNARKL